MTQDLQGFSTLGSRSAARQRRHRFKPVLDSKDLPEAGLRVDQKRHKYNFLYTREHQANLLNFIDFLSEEIQPGKQHVQLLPEFPLVDARYIGSGETMEVYATTWKSETVAVKRLNRDQQPIRNTALPLEKDIAYLQARNSFYSKVKNVIQEVLISCREPMSDHRNIVRLLALSWDEIDLANDNTDLFAPLLITELAHEITPTLQGYYQDRSTDRAWGVSREFIADIADGVTVLHTCGVIHGDLKPENILLFRDRESGCGLIAKIGDFGYAGVDGLRRGRTRRWTAPECLDGCPSDILADATMMPIAADVYSFGLLVLFILLNGRSPTEALGLSDEGFDKLRFSSNGLETFQTLFRHDVNDRPYWDKHEKHPSSLNQTVQVILEETLCRAPSRRTSSLKHIRKLITGEDRFWEQKKNDLFRLRPYKQLLSSYLNPSNFMLKTKIPFSNFILQSLPIRLKQELVTIAGEIPDPYEPYMHTMRRQELRKKLLDAKKDEQKGRSDEAKLSLRSIYEVGNMAADFLDTCNGMSTLFKIEDNVFHDFIESDYRDRPPIFTWIEVNKIEMVRKTLDTDPLQANCTLPHGGWRPIHLAAWLGRVNIIFLLVQEYGVNPNSYTSSGKYYTPLHQAVGALSIDGINALLDSGANINAEAMSQTRPHTPLEYAILLDELAQEKRLEDVISLLLGRGANYLYSSVGFSICFKCILKADRLKLIFDSIGAEDAKRLVLIVDDHGNTLLHAAARSGFDKSVELLLDLGADPSARNYAGQTPYSILMGSEESFIDPISGPTGTLFFRPQLLDARSIARTRMLLEKQGPSATDLSDYTFTAEEVNGFLTRSKTRRQNHSRQTMKRAVEAFQLATKYLTSNNAPYLERLKYALGAASPFQLLLNSLSEWTKAVSEGQIAPDHLPLHWEEFLIEANREMADVFTRNMEVDQVLEICQLLKRKLRDLCLWIVDHNGLKALMQLELIYQRAKEHGILEELGDHVLTIALLPSEGLASQQRRISFSHTILIQRLRRIWRCLARDDLLDSLHELAVLTGTDRLIDALVYELGRLPLGEYRATPPFALKDVEISRRYSGTAIFITRLLIVGWPANIIYFIIQFTIFTWPALVLLISLYLRFREMAVESAGWVVASWAWAYGLAWAEWKLFDRDYSLHPNILRGLQASYELIILNLRHPSREEEPLILSVRAKQPRSVEIPERLAMMKTTTLFPVYWLPLTENAVHCPVPCYAATREIVSKWRMGTLPRRAWGYGWWEVEQQDGTGQTLKRVDVNHRPSWTQLTKASRRIKALLKDDTTDKYKQFLAARDYGIDTEAEQLAKMRKVFMPQHPECYEIWQDLFLVREQQDGGSRPPSSHRWRSEVPTWATYVLVNLKLHFLWDKVTAGWGVDGALLNPSEDVMRVARAWGAG